MKISPDSWTCNCCPLCSTLEIKLRDICNQNLSIFHMDTCVTSHPVFKGFVNQHQSVQVTLVY